MIQRSAVLYLAHAWSPVHTLRFCRLRRQTAGIADCYVLYQSATSEAPDGPRHAAAGAIHVFQASELPNRLGYGYLTPDGLVPGCTHYPVIDFSKGRAYRHYWLIEGDVEFTGDWATLLRKGSATEAGLLASHVRRYRDAPDWVWWGSLRAPVPAGPAIPWRIGKLRKAFLPVCRISFEALHLIDRLHRRGCEGHSEMLLPTAIFNAGLDVADLNTLNALYRGTEQDPGPDVVGRSTLRWRPEVSLAEFAQTFAADTIYHPVKGEWTFDGIDVIVARADGHVALSLEAPDFHRGPADDGPACNAAARAARPRHQQPAAGVALAMPTAGQRRDAPRWSARRSMPPVWRIAASYRDLLRRLYLLRRLSRLMPRPRSDRK